VGGIDGSARLEERRPGQDRGEQMAEQEIRERLWQWRRAHPQATFDEIDAEVARQYAAEEAAMVAALSVGGTEAAAGEQGMVVCPQCQTPMQHRGRRTRQALSRRGEAVPLTRDYYVCPACGAGLFPPG